MKGLPGFALAVVLGFGVLAQARGAAGAAQQVTAQAGGSRGQGTSGASSSAPNSNTSYIDEQGTAHITRVVPVPGTISLEAQRSLKPPKDSGGNGGGPAVGAPAGEPSAGLKRQVDEWSRIFPSKIEETTIAGVPVHVVTPEAMPESNRDKVLLELHGGGFAMDSGSYAETIPVAGVAKIKAIAVLYREVPAHPFPAAVDDVVEVYREMLKTHSPGHIAIYGASAGAVLTAEAAARIKQLGLPMPGALGVFSGFGDFDHPGDSWSIFEVRGLASTPPYPFKEPQSNTQYVGRTDRRDPVLSPIYSDLHGMPPTLFVTSERDMLLSGTVNLHRAFLRAGVDARLIVFDGLPHLFWYDSGLPESLEANRDMGEFFARELSR